MNRTITQRALRNDSAAVLRAAEAEAGETLVITRNGTAVAELRPLAAPARRWVPRAALAVAAQHAPPIDAARLRADLKAVIDPSLAGVDG